VAVVVEGIRPRCRLWKLLKRWLQLFKRCREWLCCHACVALLVRTHCLSHAFLLFGGTLLAVGLCVCGSCVCVYGTRYSFVPLADGRAVYQTPSAATTQRAHHMAMLTSKPKLMYVVVAEAMACGPSVPRPPLTCCWFALGLSHAA